MKVCYSNHPLPDLSVNEQRIFLAGPTPRDTVTASWRPSALEILYRLGFEGNVLVPEWDTGFGKVDYMDQVEWEWAGLHNSVRAFWVPRNLQTMPAFTTNVEFGLYLESGIVYGRPDDAHNCRYLDWIYNRVTGLHPHHNLQDLLQQAVLVASQGYAVSPPSSYGYSPR
jgi:hypothetical protein